MPKASINAIVTIIRNAQRLGVDIDTLQQRVGISSQLLSDPDKRIDSIIGFQLMEEAEKLADDPLFGLHHGSQFQPADMGLVGFLVLNAPTVKQAVESFCKFQKIYGEGLQIQTSTSKGEVKVSFVPHPALGEVNMCGAFYSHMSGFVATIDWLLNRKVEPVKVNIGRKAPEKLAQQKEFNKIFGPHVKYSTAYFSILYDKSCFEANVLTKNPELFKLFEHRAETVVRQFGREDNFKSTVAACLLKSLDGNKPSLESISEKLHKSPRTIQRLLKAEGATFQEVLNEVRQTSAKYYLETSGLNIDEISYLLGFSDASAFRKSFKKVSNCSPEAYRKSLAK